MARIVPCLAACAIAWSAPLPAFQPQANALIEMPAVAAAKAADDLAAMVARLNAGATDVDFTALREAAMGAPGFSGYNMLDRSEVEKAAQANDWKRVIALCNDHLADDFIDINAHTYLALAHRKLGQVELADKHRRIWTGLVDSIFKSGDGTSPKTAFRVTGTDEEYFVMRILRLRPQGQALVNKDGLFDRHAVIAEDGAKREIWFDISGFFGKL